MLPLLNDLRAARDELVDASTVGLPTETLVAGLFQAFDQDFMVNALARLGSAFVGVTQLPVTATDEELLELDLAGVRAVRFNLRRGGSEDVRHLESMALRIYERVGWHVELYVDSRELAGLKSLLSDLPAVSRAAPCGSPWRMWPARSSVSACS